MFAEVVQDRAQRAQRDIRGIGFGLGVAAEALAQEREVHG